MTPEQKEYFDKQNKSMLKYHSKKQTAKRRRVAQAQAQAAKNNERDNTLFLLGLIAAFAVMIAIAMAFPVCPDATR